MTTAKFNYQNGRYNSFEVIGHADYAEYGYDIVCSSITTAVFTTLGIIQMLLKKEEYSYEEKDGIVRFESLVDNQLVSDVILNLYNVLDNIQRQYPKNLKIKIAK